MPRRKEFKLNIFELECNGVLIAELMKNPLLENFDMNSIEIKILHRKPDPVIKKDIDKVIDTLLRYESANKEKIEVFNGKQLISKHQLSKMMRVNRATLDKWINDGFISPTYISELNLFCYQVKDVVEQLKLQKR